MPSALPVVSRRHMLFGAAALAAAGRHRRRMRRSRRHRRKSTTWQRNSTVARSRQPARHATPRRHAAARRAAPALTAVASERSTHAQALSDEIARMVGKDAPTTTATSTTAQPATAPTDQGRDRRAASVSRQRRTIGGQAVRLSRRAARLDRRIVHGGLHGRAGPAEARNDLTGADAHHHARRTDVLAGGRTHHARTAVGRRRTPPCSTRSPPSTRPSTATGWCRRTRRPTSTTWCRPRWRSTANGARRAIEMLRAAVRRPAAARRRLSAADRGRQPDRRGQPRGAHGRGRRRRVAGGARAGDRRARTARSR